MIEALQICPEDVVSLISDPSTPGMVCCVGDNADSTTAPTAHVYWLRENDNDRMELISDLTIIDRALLHGDTGVKVPPHSDLHLLGVGDHQNALCPCSPFKGKTREVVPAIPC